MAADLQDNLALKKLREYEPEAVEDARIFRDEVTLYIRVPFFLRVCKFLRDDPSLKFNFLADVTALDLFPQEPRFEVILHLLAFAYATRLRLKVRIGGENPICPSACPIWPSANAFEREVFDLFGVKFEGHPDLRRIVLPDEWEGFPLRKDYPVEGYR